MSLRTKIVISVIALMLQGFAVGETTGMLWSLNAVMMCVNCWLLGGYIKEATS